MNPNQTDLPVTVLTLLLHFSEETKTMSHHDRATTAITLIRELERIADEETRESVVLN